MKSNMKVVKSNMVEQKTLTFISLCKETNLMTTYGKKKKKVPS